MDKYRKFPKEKSLNAIKEIALRVFESDQERNKLLERKAEILLGFLGVIIPLLVALFYYFYTKHDLSFSIFYIFKILLVIKLFFFATLTLTCFVMSAIFCILTLTIRTFRNIDILRIWKEEGRGKNVHSIVQIKKDLISHFCSIHKFNKEVLNKKARTISIAFYSLIPGLVLMIVVFIILVFLY